MEERNKQTLNEALRQLPQYQAPAGVWEEIALNLEQAEREEALQRAIRRLPEYAPPPAIWDQIEDQLEAPRQTGRLMLLKPLRWQFAAAILVLVMASGGYLLFRSSEQPDVQYLTSQESLPAAIPVTENPEDEAAFEEVTALYAQYRQQFLDPQANELEEEWAELNAARQELQQALDQYGYDAVIAQQLTEIELERSKVVRKMAAML